MCMADLPTFVVARRQQRGDGRRQVRQRGRRGAGASRGRRLLRLSDALQGSLRQTRTGRLLRECRSVRAQGAMHMHQGQSPRSPFHLELLLQPPSKHSRCASTDPAAGTESQLRLSDGRYCTCLGVRGLRCPTLRHQGGGRTSGGAGGGGGGGGSGAPASSARAGGAAAVAVRPAESAASGGGGAVCVAASRGGASAAARAPSTAARSRACSARRSSCAAGGDKLRVTHTTHTHIWCLYGRAQPRPSLLTDPAEQMQSHTLRGGSASATMLAAQTVASRHLAPWVT